MSEWKQLWLQYHPTENAEYRSYAQKIVIEGFADSQRIRNLLDELTRGLDGMLGIRPVGSFAEGRTLPNSDRELLMASASGGAGDFMSAKESRTEEARGPFAASMREDGFIHIQKVPSVTENRGELSDSQREESYRIFTSDRRILIQAADEKGALNGAFALLRGIGTGKKPQEITGTFIPSNPLRMLNHWDNMTNDIERGYSGNSFFFRDGEVVVNERTVDYARLASSIGINGTVLNNVNVKGDAAWLISDRYYERLREMAEIFEGWGIRLFLCLDFAAPIDIGGLDTCDPLDERVVAWWKEKMAEVFAAIPDFGGFVVKADSEGRPGPFTYGRTQMDGANMLADIVRPYGGIIIWRCFVYNCAQDWRDRKTDRARAGYDNFMPMDGQYHDNVILQIKNGPMDFQIREPVSPLIGGLKATNQMLEVQIAQEYTGQQIDVCYLIPMFKEILEFRTFCTAHGAGTGTKGDPNDRVKDIVSGRTFGNGASGMAGFAAVANTGDDPNWTGNDLAAANLYGFGRLAFDTELSAEEIAGEWTRLTFDTDEAAEETILRILMKSRSVYEKYTTPLGIGWMVTPSVHYGCSVDGYEYSSWGAYHRADHLGLGVDRSSDGTGYAQQYYPENAAMYDDPDTCPEELLLFFHHVPYTQRLKDGRTLIQYLYDCHFEGYEEVQAMAEEFRSLKGRIPEDAYRNITGRFGRQLANAREWRDQFNRAFHIKSGIDDEKGRTIY